MAGLRAPGAGRTWRVLVLGDDTRSFLAMVRGLGRDGIEVHVAPADLRSPALQSRYIRQIHQLPQWVGDGSRWLNALEGLLQRIAFDVVFPCNETTLLPLQMHRQRFAALARLALPNDAALDVLFDKAKTRELAVALGIAVAPGRLLHQGDSAAGLIGAFGIPIVVKPTRSYRLEALHRREKVRICRTEDALQRLIDVADPAATLIEACFEGAGLGISICAQDGIVVQSFEHHRVYEDDGASYYRVSAPCDPDRLAAVEAMAAQLRFTGIAMFEFKRAGDGAWILLEVNARPWGSMPLPLALGLNFPRLWFQSLVGGTPAAPVAYRFGIFGRNLFPDIKAILGELRDRPTLAGKACHAARRIWDFRRAVTGLEVHDVSIADDRAPARAEMRQFLVEFGSRLVQSLPWHRWYCERQAKRRVKHAVPSRGTIVLVCSGNICRSPFAAHLLQRSAPAGLEICSAGTLPMPGRPAPDMAIDRARAYGIELDRHLSHMVTDADIENADLIVIFDQINRHDLLSRYPSIETKMVCLGDFIGLGRIADPIEGDAEVFDATFAEIAHAITRLAECLPAR